MFTERQQTTSAGPCNVAVGPENGPPLVFFHGVTRRWNCFLPILPLLSTRWQIYAIDFPGHGGSEARLEEYSVTDYCRFAGDWIRDQFKHRVAIYGHSLGAMVAAEVAGRQSGQVMACILEDPPFHTMGSLISRTPLLSYFKGLMNFAGIRELGQGPGLQRLQELIVEDPSNGMKTRLDEMRSGSAIRFMAECLSCLDPSVLTSIVECRWLEHYAVDTVFQRLSIPTLLLQADPMVGGMLRDETVMGVRRIRPEVHVEMREGVGHQLHWGDPDWVANESLLFLESIRGNVASH